MRPVPAEHPKQHVTSTPGVCGGKPCIVGTRVRVWDIASRAEAGESPDEILLSFPHLTLADVHAALAYFYDNRDAIENGAKEDQILGDQLHKELGPGPLEEKLRSTAVRPESSPDK
jgi:uncharacterized protein (DUF433 family)